MTRSQAAFLFSAERLFAEEPKVYFWTFTWEKVMPDWFYANCWARFIRELSNLHGGTLRGVKVVELHREHGIHYHCLLNKRLPVGHVRWLGKRYGIGRVHVERALGMGAANYISEYIKPREKLFAGASRWGCMGGFRGCRVKDVEIDSLFHRRMARAREILQVKKLPWVFASELFRSPFMSDLDFDLRCQALRGLKYDVAFAPGCLSESRRIPLIYYRNESLSRGGNGRVGVGV